jgi:hypothetical protein
LLRPDLRARSGEAGRFDLTTKLTKHTKLQRRPLGVLGELGGKKI